MKKIVLVTTLASFFLQLTQGQNTEWTDNFQLFTHTTQLKFTLKGELIMATGFEFSPFEESEHKGIGFIVFDSTGQLLFKQDLMNSFSEGEITDILIAPDSSIYFLGAGTSCDLEPPSWVRKYDSEWNILWENNGWDDQIYGMGSGAVLPNGDLIFNHELVLGYLSMYSADGNFLWKKEIGKELDLIRTQNGNIILAGYEGLKELDASGMLLHQYFEKEVFTKIELLNDSVFLVSKSNKLLKISSNFERIDSLSNISDFAVFKNQFSVLRQIGNDNFIELYSTDFQLINSFKIPINEGSPIRTMTMNNKKVVVGGTELNFRHSSMYCKSFDFNDLPQNLETDVGLTEVWTDSPPYVYILNNDPWPDINYIKFEDVYVKVKNFGDSVIDSLEVRFTDGPFSFFCSSHFWSRKKYKNLSLLPGDSITLFYGNVSMYQGITIDPTPELCLYTALPNNQLDRNHSNDSVCETLIINNLENIRANKDFNIFPNPVRDKLQIKLPPDLKSDTEIFIFDAVGKLVLEHKTTIQAPLVQLNINNLSTGIYFIKIISNRQEFISKILKI